MNLSIHNKDQFRIALSEFQDKVTSTWVEKRQQRIGVSIQLLEMKQDEKSCTRYKAVNKYCQSILHLKDKHNAFAYRDSCDRLDYELKEELQRLGINGIGCRCHKGISNIVTKFIDKVDRTEYFIFYGQFILTNTYNDKQLVDDYGIKNVSEMKRAIGLSTLKNYGIITDETFTASDYVQRIPFTNSEEVLENAKTLKKNKPQTETLIKDLSQVNIIDFLSFKTHVEIEFGSFLDNIHKDKDTQVQVAKVVEEFKDSTEDKYANVSTVLGSCKQSLSASLLLREIEKDEKPFIHKVIELIEKIEQFISSDIDFKKADIVEQIHKHIQDGEENDTMTNSAWITTLEKLYNSLTK